MFKLFPFCRLKIWPYFILLFIFHLSCTHKNTDEQTRKLAGLLVNDSFRLAGSYYWNFQLMGGTQRSRHSFYEDSIGYVMEGNVYSTQYTMKKLSYDQDNNKWIGQDGNGVVYVLFFKNFTGSTVDIYKHKCKKNGLEEAISFEKPVDHATEDHGWNIYSKDPDDAEDILAIKGNFSHANNLLVLHDTLVILNGRSFSKLSYHAGERRWVGEADSSYLQLFFGNVDHQDSLAIAVSTFTDLEKAYRVKYQSVPFDRFNRISKILSEH